MTGTPAVVKFGGAVLSDPDAVVQRLRSYLRRGVPVVAVVSAREGVTDRLLSLARHPTDTVLRARTVQALRHQHPGSTGPLRRLFLDLERVPDRSRRQLEPDGVATDALLAQGERLAVEWLVPQLRDVGLPAVAVDSGTLGLWTDGRHGSATILLDRSRRSVRRGLLPMLSRGQLPVVTGYFGRGPRGEPVTLGRGGSDYSASAIGALVGARFVELVKRDAAVLSGDPALVPRARPVARLSYAEAEELAEFGVRVLHPMAIEPARRSGFEIRVRSLGDPHRSTSIGAWSGRPEVRAITVSPRHCLWRLRFPGGRGRTGVLAEVCAALAEARIPVLQAFTSAAVVSLVVDLPRSLVAREVLARLVADRCAHLEGPFPISLVAVVGAGAISAVPRIP
ncbi:MAG TPA: aspartate kinase, partial [Thermoplasmata archaeon]|nr:aspartate kinase [Thermoplasmata archaeon]